jgi:hypothetical protein
MNPKKKNPKTFPADTKSPDITAADEMLRKQENQQAETRIQDDYALTHTKTTATGRTGGT